MRFKHSSLDLITAPAREPISLDEAKAHLRIDVHDEDSYILNLIAVARQYVENATRRALLTQTFTQYHDLAFFPDMFVMLRPPLQSITSIKYVDTDGVEQTVSSALYEVDITAEPGRVYLDYDQTWPTDVRTQRKSVYLTFVAGYGDPEDVPQPIIQAIKIMMAHYHENRELVVFNQNPQEVPVAVSALLEPYVIRWEI